ncbi:MAG: hypothetical protein AAFP89_21640 [Bacteroidota bacterium]
MSPKQYTEQVKFIWKNYVPQSGQSEFVQGELLIAVEKLRYEAQDNGNTNWDGGHEVLAVYIKTTLIDDGKFDVSKQGEITGDIARLLDFDNPYLEDDIYDRLTERVVDFFIQNPEPILHVYNEDLHR